MMQHTEDYRILCIHDSDGGWRVHKLSNPAKLCIRSKGNIWYQALWYLIAFCIVTCIVNSINCIWVAVAGKFVPNWLYNIGTTVLNGGVSMVVFFFVNKIIFPEGEAKN